MAITAFLGVPIMRKLCVGALVMFVSLLACNLAAAKNLPEGLLTVNHSTDPAAKTETFG
jgi:hypothetical protein